MGLAPILLAVLALSQESQPLPDFSGSAAVIVPRAPRAGDVIRYECTWDRENAPMLEPHYITWNEGTVDEMCFSSVSVIPDVNSEGEPNRFAP